MKMIVSAVLIAVLIVCGAYFGSHWYYGDDPIPLVIDSQLPRITVGTSQVEDSEVDELTTSGTFADESDNDIAAESSDAMEHFDEQPIYSSDTRVIDEPSPKARDWEEERHKASIADLSDKELRERFLASVESGKFARKLREYFERKHGKGPEVDVLVRYYDKSFKGQAMLSDSIDFQIARQALGLAGPQEMEAMDRAFEHLEEYGDEPVGGSLTVTALHRLRKR